MPPEPAPSPPEPRPERAGVFERPAVRDPLLWAGIVLGAGMVLLSPPGAGAAWYVALLDVVLTVVAGVALAAFFGGFARNLLRALADDDGDPGEHPTP